MADSGAPLGLLVRELMRSPVVTVEATADLSQAGAIMELRHVRHLPVLEQGKLVGLLTHRDLLHARMSSTVHLAPRERMALERRIEAHTIMRRDVATVRPDTKVVDAARKMLEHKYGCLPVVEGDALVGILTEADLVDFLVRLLAHVAP